VGARPPTQIGSNRFAHVNIGPSRNGKYKSALTKTNALESHVKKRNILMRLWKMGSI